MELEEIVVMKNRGIPSLQMLCVKAFVRGRTLSKKESATLKNIANLKLPTEIDNIIQAYQPFRIETINAQLDVFHEVEDTEKIDEALRYLTDKRITIKDCFKIFMCACDLDRTPQDEYNKYIKERRLSVHKNYQSAFDRYAKNGKAKYVLRRNEISSFGYAQFACCCACLALGGMVAVLALPFLYLDD
jgi:hypothetical protein